MTSLLLGPVLRHVMQDSATVWVEVDSRCTVSVAVTGASLRAEAPTFEVAGHFYALVVLTGLPPGRALPYRVELDGEPVWPPTDASAGIPGAPPPVIRTPQPEGARRVVFGSCRVASPSRTPAEQGTEIPEDALGIDALDAFALRAAAAGAGDLPDLLLMLGDQVYADETSDAVAAAIRSRRGRSAPRDQVADFEEYTWLYRESWGDGPIRWLFATVPVAMIFDDHDVHDDWNTSAGWRRDMAATSWWRERLVGGLVSYWVYQHLGNLSPRELAADETYRAVLAAAAEGRDAMPVLRRLAESADAAVGDREGGYRWSFWRDLGPLRVVVLDSRCGRVLSDDDRRMLPDSAFRWFEELVGDTGAYRHLAVGTSLPWLLNPTLHAAEAWSEQLGAGGRVRRAVAERMRRGLDLEHWAAFGSSFERLAGVLQEVSGAPDAPATVSVLSGDVHHSYVSGVDLGLPAATSRTRVHQVTCSPVHNVVPAVMRAGFRAVWSAAGERISDRLLHRAAGVPRPSVHWRTLEGPVFGNCIATLTVEGDSARVLLESPVRERGVSLRTVAERDL